MVNQVEAAFNETKETGFYASGLVSINNSLLAIINWYDQYTFISKSVLRMKIEQMLKKCKK